MSRTTSLPWPKIPSGFVVAVLSGHSALGLTFAAVIYVLCFSGTVIVFANEILRWEQPQGPIVTATDPATLAYAAEAGHRRAIEKGSGDELFIQLPSEELPRLLVQIADHVTGEAETWFANAEGQIVNEQNAPWWQFLIALHFRLLLPGIWGLVVVGLSGVFLLSLIVSGVLAHPRIFKDAFHLRWGGSKRLQEADLHNRLSVWGLPFHIAIAFSGAYLALAPIMNTFLVDAAYRGDLERGFGEIFGPGPGTDHAPAPLPDLDRILADVATRFPDASVETIIVQEMATNAQLVHITTTRPGQLNEFERHFYSAEGELLRTAGYDDGPSGIQWAGAMTPLHYGWFGGWPVKIAYGILGAALTLIAVSGVTIWLARWSDKGRPLSHWQRVWTGIVWGQPLGFGLSALGAVAGLSDWVLHIYLVAVLSALVAAAFIADNVFLSRVLRFGGGGVLLLLVWLHSLVWSAHFADGMALLVSMLLVILAIAMIATAPGGFRKRA